VQQRYIFEGEGYDQFLGRVASGLPLNSPDFATLPPRLNPSYVISLLDWKTLYPNYDAVPKSIQRCFPYLLASLAYHREWLSSNLSGDHPLFRSAVWTANYLEKVDFIFGNDDTDPSGMKPTGIPPNVSVITKLQVMENAMNRVTEIISKNHDESKKELPNLVGSYILNTFQVQGAIPVTLQHFDTFREQLLQEFRQINQNGGSSAENALTESTESEEEQYKYYFWGNRFHIVPENFSLKNMSIKHIWDMWNYGDKAKNLPPYNLITAKFDLKTKNEQKLIYKAKTVIDAIEEAGRAGYIMNGNISVSKMSRIDGNSIFNIGLSEIIKKIELKRSFNGLYNNPNKRYGEISFTTLYNSFKFLKTSLESIFPSTIQQEDMEDTA
jgi:hypothetical protein